MYLVQRKSELRAARTLPRRHQALTSSSIHGQSARPGSPPSGAGSNSTSLAGSEESKKASSGPKPGFLL